MGDVILKLTGVNKIFPGTQALTNVDFDLREGEVHSLVGPNGSGKSTLMNIIAGLYLPTSGKVELYGKEVEFSTPSDAINSGITMIHQELKLFSELSVAENVCYGRFPKTKVGSIDWNAMREYAAQYVNKLDKDIKMNDIVGTLSIAKQQIVEISKAISKNAKILIMDEPTASLTMEEAKILFETVRELKKQNITIVFISHRLDEVLEISDRVTILRDSFIIDTRDNDGTLTKEDIVSMMVNKNVSVDRRKVVKDCSNEETAIRVSNLTYRNKLNDVSFEAKKGEVLGIAGLIGAGRSELLRCIFGEYRDWSGEMELFGKPYKPKGPGDGVKHKVAYISEDRKGEGLVLPMSIRDNMLFASFDKHSNGLILKQGMITKDVADMISELKLKCSSQTNPASSLSGGNQQKVVLGKWLLADSDLVLMDEPTRGIDVGAKDEIYNLAENLAASGKCVLFVSSELEEVLKVSDRILVLHEGTKTAELPNIDITIEEVMRYATRK